MNVVILTASLSSNAGGLYFTITSLSKALLECGVNLTVVGFEDEKSLSELYAFEKVPVISYRRISMPVLKSFGYSKDLLSILNTLRPDIIHIQGLWMYHSWAALRYKQHNPTVKTIIEPHGMLDKWAINNSKWKKRFVGHLFEYKNLISADCIHALCESEMKSIRSIGLTNPIAIIPNGIDIPPDFIRPTKKTKTLLYLGRIHPKKGLKELLMALSKIKNESPSFFNKWKVRIAGWDQSGFKDKLIDYCSQEDLYGIIKFIGPVFGDEKISELKNADAFILPSFSEGLPMTILEAWSYKLPVIMTDYCNLPQGFSMKAAIRTEPNADTIYRTLIQLYSMSNDNLLDIGNNGYNIVKSQFQWKKIAERTLELYNAIMINRDYPSFVHE